MNKTLDSSEQGNVFTERKPFLTLDLQHDNKTSSSSFTSNTFPRQSAPRGDNYSRAPFSSLSLDQLLLQIKNEQARYQQLLSEYETCHVRSPLPISPMRQADFPLQTSFLPHIPPLEWKGTVYLDASLGIAHDKNSKFMEDDYFGMKLQGSGNIWLLAGVCDGHSMDGKNGKKAAQLVKTNLPNTVLSIYDEDSRNPLIFKVDVPSVLTRSFQEMDKLMHRVSDDLFETAGCTTSIVAICGSPLNTFDKYGRPIAPPPISSLLGGSLSHHPPQQDPSSLVREGIQRLPIVTSHGERELYCANVGDSEVYLFSSDPTVDPIELTRCHLATDPEERQRCKDAGADVTEDDGTPYGNRVNGMQVTRSIGDFMSEQTISTPDVKRIPLTPELAAGNRFDIKRHPTDQYAIPPPTWVVMGSDGLWDVVPAWNCHQLITTFIGTSKDGPFPHEYPCPQAVASHILSVCIDRYNNPDLRVSPFPPSDQSHSQFTSSSTHNPNKRISRDNVAVVVIRLDWKPLYESPQAEPKPEPSTTSKPKKQKRGFDMSALKEQQFDLDTPSQTQPIKAEEQVSGNDPIETVPRDETGGEANDGGEGGKKKKKKKKKKKGTGEDEAKDED
ncbi:putative Protein phosphatase 2C [Blattamonas nauphoetae]|uniref:PPM-type phosphatase domain-containing protein n=1 Tax=Blattamonas nauphoetae TaxID=2049346 RepID=A0ABQ9Y5S8_9EUKA|nr:putative Protein phosphatase 2C [Blattamonas nauphoetae]